MGMTLRQLLFYDGPTPRAPRSAFPTEIDGIPVESEEGDG